MPPGQGFTCSVCCCVPRACLAHSWSWAGRQGPSRVKTRLEVSYFIRTVGKISLTLQDCFEDWLEIKIKKLCTLAGISLSFQQLSVSSRFLSQNNRPEVAEHSKAEILTAWPRDHCVQQAQKGKCETVAQWSARFHPICNKFRVEMENGDLET